MTVVTELVTKFSFSGSTAPLEDFNKNLGGAVGLLGTVTGAIAAVSGAINALVITTLSGADAIGQLAINTGVSVERLQELNYAASVSGSSAAAMESSISNLSQTIGQAAQKGNEDFARLGISVRDASGRVKTADVILSELRGSFKRLGLSMQEQQGFAQALGIDASLVQLLNKTDAELAGLTKRARAFGLVTDQQQAAIIDFNDSMTTLRFGMDAIRKQVAIGLSPTIKALSERFTDFMATHKDTLINGFIRFGEGVNVVIDSAWRLRYVLGALVVGLVAVSVASLPISGTVLAIAAAIAAALVVIDDLIVAFKGGNSVIREFVMEATGLDITPILQKTVAFTKEVIKAFKLMASIIIDQMQAIYYIFTGNFDKAFTELASMFDKIMEYPAVKAFTGLFDKAANFLGFGNEPALAPGGGSQIANNSNISQAVTIQIVTDDPQAAGQAVNDSLQSQLDNANAQLKRGGR